MAFFERPFFFFFKKRLGTLFMHTEIFLPCSFSLHALGYPLLFNDLDKNVNYHEHSRKWHFGEIFLYTRNSFIKKWLGFFSPIQIAGLYTLYLHCICLLCSNRVFSNFRLDCYHWLSMPCINQDKVTVFTTIPTQQVQWCPLGKRTVP